ncbi:hypothetical protein CSC79_12615 [Pseudoalteromonas sp. 3D05]|nr:hypothetical protein CSC79_12615 [Pseudoalteromonas sp. 3D05]
MMHLTPTWHAPNNIGALSTTREGGFSDAPFASLNLGLHVGDNQQHVQQNRQILTTDYLPASPIWLNQVHSSDVVIVDEHFDYKTILTGDALFTREQNQPLAIMTADCLPILLSTQCGSEIAAIHGGWRGLNAGIITNTVSNFSFPASDIIAWLGPAIGAQQFEVGAEVKASFIEQSVEYEQAFSPLKINKYLLDIYAIAQLQLRQTGVKTISGGEHCTVSQPEMFFSYRRDGKTGRMASLIWRK